MKIKHIDHIVLRAADVDKMMRWYMDVLGCTLEKIQEQIGLYQLRAGASLIDFVSSNGETGGKNLEHFCLTIDGFDGDELTAYLRSKGCNPGPVQARYGADGDGPSLYIEDPEGNVIELKG